MDVNALVSRDKAYFTNLVDNGKLTLFLPELNLNLIATATVTDSESGSVVTITAPFSPTANQSVSQLQVLEKAPTDPTSYASTWVTTSTATLSPSPSALSIGQQVLIGTNTYQISEIDGNNVTFVTPVSEVAVFYANVASPDVTYQWQVSEDDGVTWVNIPGATDRSYEPLAGDVGDDLRVIISYVDGQGTIEKPSLAPPSTQPQFVYPVFPQIANIELDLVRQYAANLLTNLIVQITST